MRFLLHFGSQFGVIACILLLHVPLWFLQPLLHESYTFEVPGTPFPALCRQFSAVCFRTSLFRGFGSILGSILEPAGLQIDILTAFLDRCF